METGIADDIAQQVETSAESAQTAPKTEPRAYALNRPLIIGGLIAATALSALDGTVVATAMPSIVGALHGLPLYPLVIAAYLLATTTTMPLFGKLSDMYGRKPVFMVGAGIFIVGSLLCGLAWDMPSLILFRGLQGLGAGAVIPVSLTLVGDLFDIEERARLSGIFSSVWGISSVIGPVVGGAIVQLWNWRWVFFVNVPVGIVAALLIFIYLREPSVHTRQRVDIAGGITLIAGLSLLLMALQTGGSVGWGSTPFLASLAGAVALLTLFAYIERRAASPVVSLDLLRRPIISVSCLAGLLSGGVLVGFAAYVPLLVQGSWGGTPIEAGLIIAPLSIGWPIASSRTGKLLIKFGYRTITLLGMFTLVAGTAMLLLILLPGVAPNGVVAWGVIRVSTFIAGLGFGFSATAMLIAVQNSVPWSERGIATASVQFFRSMGNAVGATMLGAVMTATLAPLLAAPGVAALLAQMPSSTGRTGSGDRALGPVNALFDLGVRDTLAHPLRTALADALATSLGWVFFGVLIMAVVGAVLAIRFPNMSMEKKN